MFSSILSSCQAIMTQFAVGGDLILNLNGDDWVVVAVVALVAFTRGR